MAKALNQEKGFVAYLITILVLAIVGIISLTIFFSSLTEQKIIQNLTKGTQAYYGAEAGIEDALLRLSKDLPLSDLYSLAVDGGVVEVSISEEVGGSRTITAKGNFLDRVRKVGVVYEISSEKISFYYGAQVGEGGLVMEDGSIVQGNVFSNGSILGKGKAQVTSTAIIAQDTNELNGLIVGKDAYVYTCRNSKIQGTLYSVDNFDCEAGSFSPLEESIATTSFPITQEMIDNWKEEALAGGVYTGDYILQGRETAFLGPQKVEGNLILKDQAKLYITGTLWVTGNVILQNKSRLFLDKDAYGSLSGTLVADGKIALKDSAKALGSGNTGSYLLLISTSSGGAAIALQNDIEADLLFAPSGWLEVQDKAKTRMVSGYGIHLKNSAQIIYEVGLENSSFSSGPGGSWQVTSWREIE